MEEIRRVYSHNKYKHIRKPIAPPSKVIQSRKKKILEELVRDEMDKEIQEYSERMETPRGES